MDRDAILERFRDWLREQTTDQRTVTREAARAKAAEFGVPPSMLGSQINQARCERVGEEYRRIADRPKPVDPRFVDEIAASAADEERVDKVMEWLRDGRALGLSASEAVVLRLRLLGGR